MADTKTTALTAQTAANVAAADLWPTVDVSDTTMAASGTVKKMTTTELQLLLEPRILPTAVKTANYSAVIGDLVPCDTTSGGFTVTLPTAPTDGAVLAVKHVIQGGTNVVTIACGGSDVFNRTGGATTTTLPLLAQAVVLQYKSSTAIWYIICDDLPLAQLDLRYKFPMALAVANAALFTL